MRLASVALTSFELWNLGWRASVRPRVSALLARDSHRRPGPVVSRTPAPRPRRASPARDSRPELRCAGRMTDGPAAAFLHLAVDHDRLRKRSSACRPSARRLLSSAQLAASQRSDVPLRLVLRAIGRTRLHPRSACDSVLPSGLSLRGRQLTTQLGGVSRKRGGYQEWCDEGAPVGDQSQFDALTETQPPRQQQVQLESGPRLN